MERTAQRGDARDAKENAEKQEAQLLGFSALVSGVSICVELLSSPTPGRRCASRHAPNHARPHTRTPRSPIQAVPPRAYTPPLHTHRRQASSPCVIRNTMPGNPSRGSPLSRAMVCCALPLVAITAASVISRETSRIPAARRRVLPARGRKVPSGHSTAAAFRKRIARHPQDSRSPPYSRTSKSANCVAVRGSPAGASRSRTVTFRT